MEYHGADARTTARGVCDSATECDVDLWPQGVGRLVAGKGCKGMIEYIKQAHKYDSSDLRGIRKGCRLHFYGFTDLPPSLPLPPADPWTRIYESNRRRLGLAPGESRVDPSERTL